MQNQDIILKTKKLKRRVALGAMYSVLRRKNNDTLMGEMNFSHRKAVIEGFEKFWGVPTQKLKLTELLLGHNKEYEPMLELLHWFVNEGHRKGDHSPESVAWDVGRYVDVLRDAFYVGYINKETAFKHLRIAYNISIGHFRSWKEYGTAFLAYKRFWDGRNMEELALNLKHHSGKAYTTEEVYEIYKGEGNTQIAWLEEAITTLLHNKSSIWNQVGW